MNVEEGQKALNSSVGVKRSDTQRQAAMTKGTRIRAEPVPVLHALCPAVPRFLVQAAWAATQSTPPAPTSSQGQRRAQGGEGAPEQGPAVSWAAPA